MITPWPVDQPTPAMCSIEICCRILLISRKTFERELKAGRLLIRECDRIGRQRRFRGEDVDAYRQGRWARTARRAS